jgi:lysylphosphatidylglycerol synthetase-like protein (DUF2156 family)
MFVSPDHAWKLVLAIVLCVAILVSAGARAPKRPVPRSELRNLVLTALILYAVGALASLRHRSVLATLVYAAGIAVCAFAAWLSRGRGDSEDPPGGDEPPDEHPPPEPNGAPRFDWPTFERDFQAYTRDRERQPAAIDS